MTSALLNGLLLGGMYALIAMGLTIQYGVARIMNLAFGEIVVAAALATWWLNTRWGLSPLAALFLIVPAGFALNWLVHRMLLTPLVRRAISRAALENDNILATFGLLFVIQGVALALVGGAYHSYSFLAAPIEILGATLSANRFLAFAVATILSLGLWLALTRTRLGTAVRAVAADPAAAQLVAIDVRRTAGLAFATGGALAAAGGVLISMFLTFSAAMGVTFTMKALMVALMGGVGNVLGCLVAGLALGLSESLVATYVDPGLTLAMNFALFLAVLLARPAGLFGKPVR